MYVHTRGSSSYKWKKLKCRMILSYLINSSGSFWYRNMCSYLQAKITIISNVHTLSKFPFVNCQLMKTQVTASMMKDLKK